MAATEKWVKLVYYVYGYKLIVKMVQFNLTNYLKSKYFPQNVKLAT